VIAPKNFDVGSLDDSELRHEVASCKVLIAHGAAGLMECIAQRCDDAGRELRTRTAGRTRFDVDDDGVVRVSKR